MSERLLTIPSKWRVSFAATAVCAALAAGLAIEWARTRAVATPAPAGPAARAIPVMAATARADSVAVTVSGLGSVTALNTVAVRSRVDGQLMRVAFKEGELVKAGDLLAEIDERPAKAGVEQAEGQLGRDEALLANARLDLARYRELLAEDSIAKQQLDTQAALVRQYEATVELDRGALDNAKIQLDYCRITAPISGRLGLRLVDVGNVVHASDTGGLVVITQVQPIAVVFTLPEEALPAVLEKLAKGEQPEVDALDREGAHRLAQGTLASVDNQIDPATGTVRLKAQFANDDGALFPNQFVNARLLLETKPDITVIPAAGVQRGAEGAFAYVVKPDHTVETRSLELGPVDGDRAAIARGLAPGELVVIEGTALLRDGSRVEVRGP